MRDDFLTIPDVPNYEINSDLQIRNKKTGRLLKTARFPSGTRCCSIKHPDTKKSIRRSLKTFRQQALAYASTSVFYLIPSNPLYEMNRAGIVRNAATKKVLKQCKTESGKKFCDLLISTHPKKTHGRRFINALKLEVFGEGKIFCQKRVPVVLSKNDRRIYFETMTAAARFLAPQLYYSIFNCIRAIKTYDFWQGWHIQRLDGDIKNACQQNNRIAHRQQRVWGSS